MPLRSEPLLNDLFKLMRERIATVCPEVIEPADDPEKVRGILTLQEMADMNMDTLEAPYVTVFTSGFERDPISAMDAQSWVCLFEIIYVRSATQSTEEMQEKALQLQIFLETRPNDDLPGVGQIARVHNISNSPSSRGNDQFISRRMANRAACLQVEIWLWRDPIGSEQPEG